MPSRSGGQRARQHAIRLLTLLLAATMMVGRLASGQVCHGIRARGQHGAERRVHSFAPVDR